MRNILIILLFPFFAQSQAIVDGSGNIINYAKYSDSLTGVVATAYKLKLKTDSLATALAATNTALLALKMDVLDSATYQKKYRCDTARTNIYAAINSKQNSGTYVITSNNLSDLSNAATARSNLGLVIGTNVLAPNGSAASLTSFPTLNQNTTGTAGGLSANITESQVTNLTTDLSAKAPLASPAFTGTPIGIGLPVYARVTGSNVTTTGQALVDITGLSIALSTNATYEFEAVLSGSVTAVTTGNQYAIQYSVAGGAIEAQITGSLTSTSSKTERITALNTATSAFLTTSAQTGGIIIKGIVTTGGNAGNLTVRHLKVTSGTSTVFINSFLKVTRIL